VSILVLLFRRLGAFRSPLKHARICLRRCAVPPSLVRSISERWESGFAALSKFLTREGHCSPLQRHVEGKFKFGKRVSVQRYHKEFLLPGRKRRLDAIGFVWEWRDNRWERNFAALLKFKRREGHCCVPTFHREGNLRLGYWVATQRRNKKQMSAGRRGAFEKARLRVECILLIDQRHRRQSRRTTR
jgi:hypothetical protein